MISIDKTTSFLKRWRSIGTAQLDLDFNRAALMRDVRIAAGSDYAAIVWCQTELGTTEIQAKALISLGMLADVAPDASTWQRLGGLRSLRALETVPTKRARIEIVEKAKAQNLQVATVVRYERAAEQKRNGIEPVKVATPREDAAALAKFVLKYVPRDKWTTYITSVVARHADLSPTVRRRAVAEQSIASARA